MAIWLSLANQHQTIQPMVSGVVDVSDPNHPTEVYYGSPQDKTLDQMLLNLDLIVYQGDKISVFPSPLLGLGSRIQIQRALPVEVTDAKKITIYRTWSKTVGDLLTEQNISLIDKDTVDPSLETPLSPDLKIKITRVAEFDTTLTETIPFKVIKKNDVNLEKGQTRVETAGVNGQREVTYHVRRVDGEEISRKVISSKVIKEPQNQILIVGIGPRLAQSGPYVDIINAAARKYLINGTALMCLMLRESNGHNTSIGYVGDEPTYYGLFQYTLGFWASASAAAGFGGADWTDPTAQIYTTAYELTHGQGRRWPPWSSCSSR